jgi:hypothetical protein
VRWLGLSLVILQEICIPLRVENQQDSFEVCGCGGIKMKCPLCFLNTYV